MKGIITHIVKSILKTIQFKNLQEIIKERYM